MRITNIFYSFCNIFAKILFLKRRFVILHTQTEKKDSNISICFAITVCDENIALQNLLNSIIPHLQKNDEILIQGDKNNVSEKVIDVVHKYKQHITTYTEFPLNHNFGEFKSNLSKQTQCNYIFQIDADEIPSPYLLKNLHSILAKNKVDLIRTARINIMIEDNEPFLLWETYKKKHQYQKLNFPDYQRRIYKNDPNIYWVHKIHEKLIGFKTVAYLPPKSKFCILHCKHWKKQIERDEQIFNVYKKAPPRRVLIDLSVLKNFNCGLGQVAYNYGKYFKKHPNLNFKIYLLLPKQYFGVFGDSVTYIPSRKIYKNMPWLMPKVDVWHSIHQLSSFQPLRSALNLLTIHDLNFVYEKYGRKKDKYMKKVVHEIQIADKITAISHYTKNDVHRIIQSDLNIEVVYNGVEKLFAKNEKKPLLDTDLEKPFLFSIGEIKRKKNFHVLLDAMKLMPEYNLYIAGKDNTDYAHEIKNRIKNENITNVFLPGIIGHEEKIWFYNHCYAFLFPSLFEGFGLPIIEALFFKKPVISSQETSLKEIGANAVFFLENFSPTHIAKTVKEKSKYFYDNPVIAEKNLDYANSFTYQKHMEKYINIYKEMLCNKQQKHNF